MQSNKPRTDFFALFNDVFELAAVIQIESSLDILLLIFYASKLLLKLNRFQLSFVHLRDLSLLMRNGEGKVLKIMVEGESNRKK